MSNDPNQGRVAPLSGTEAKTPLERAKQIQEMQRQMDAQPVAPVATPAASPVNQTQTPAAMQKVVEVFETKPVEAVNMLKPSADVAAEQSVYGAKQVANVFATGDIEIQGEPILYIPWEAPKSAAVLDLKKPAENYVFTHPQNAVKHKEGQLFLLSATPKSPGEPPVKRAVLVDTKGAIKGTELKGKEHLERVLTEVPEFKLNLFQSVFGEGVIKDTPKQHHRVVNVETGKKSAFEVKIERKNELDGKWKSETVTLNNFGIRVPPSNDRRRHDIVVAMYYLDRFNAA